MLNRCTRRRASFFFIRSLIELRSVVGICRTRSCGTDIFLSVFHFSFLMFWNTGCLSVMDTFFCQMKTSRLDQNYYECIVELIVEEGKARR